MKTKKIYVTNLHCRSCEKLLEEEISNIREVKSIKVDSFEGTAEIEYDVEPDFLKIKKITQKFGYDAFEKDPQASKELTLNKNKKDWTQWPKAFLIVGLILIIYGIFRSYGLIDQIGNGGNQITYGVSFLVGMAASVSSCLAVVGAVVITFAEKYKTEGKSFFDKAVRPNLFFHVGRLSTFFVLGGVLGAIGAEFSVSGSFVSIFTIIIALVMGWLGLNILGILPSISRLGVSLPKKLTAKWDNLKKSEHKAAPFLLGGLSFFLPCGFTQSMQIFALASGSFLVGGLSLFIFALGTAPALLVLGITTSWTKGKGMALFQKVAGIIVVLFAIYTLQSGWALWGVKSNVITNKKEQTAVNTPSSIPTDAQVVNMKITASGFEPSLLKIKSGMPVKWVINGDEVSGCTNRIIVPSLKISRSITRGENVITFTPTEKGDLAFSCGMGMVRGKFIVE